MALSLGVTAVASNTSGATVTTPSRTTTSGSTVVLMGTWGAQTFSSFTDSKGNTWTQIQTESGPSPTTRMYYAANLIGGTSHTFTLTLGSSGTPSICMVEVLGT